VAPRLNGVGRNGDQTFADSVALNVGWERAVFEDLLEGFEAGFEFVL